MELLSYLGLVLTILSVYLISVPRLAGQYGMLAGHVCWLIYSTYTRNGAMFLQSLILFLITIRAVHNWTMKGIKL